MEGDIFAFGNVMPNPSDIIPEFSGEPMISDFYAVVYCYSGSCDMKIDLEEYHFQAGQLLVLRPGELHHLQKVDNYDALLLAFHKNLFIKDNFNHYKTLLNHPFFNANRQNIIDLDEVQQQRITSYFTAIHERENNNSRFTEDILKSLLSALIYEICAIFSEIPGGTNLPPIADREEIFYKFGELINVNHRFERNVKYYADRLNISPAYLSEISKGKTGKNALAIIHEQIIYQVKILLKNTDYSVSEISSYFSFSETSAFIRFFKRHAHTSPLKYRKS
jgi:AraC-like DNA-binding protein